MKGGTKAYRIKLGIKHLVQLCLLQDQCREPSAKLASHPLSDLFNPGEDLAPTPSSRAHVSLSFYSPYQATSFTRAR